LVNQTDFQMWPPLLKYFQNKLPKSKPFLKKIGLKYFFSTCDFPRYQIVISVCINVTNGTYGYLIIMVGTSVKKLNSLSHQTYERVPRVPYGTLERIILK
jgi:hypothetical protein